MFHQVVKRIYPVKVHIHTTLWKLSDIFLGNRSRFDNPAGAMGSFAGPFSRSLCIVKASIQGILTRIEVSALYTPSVFLAVVI